MRSRVVILIVIAIIVALVVLAYLKNRNKNKEAEKEIEKQRLDAIKNGKNDQEEDFLDKKDSIGKMAYAAWEDSLVNVRTSPSIENGGWDFITNKLGEVSYTEAIGEVIEQEKDQEGKTWYKIKLVKPMMGWFTKVDEGYVIANAVKLQ